MAGNIEYLPERLPAFQNVIVSDVHTPPELRLRQVHDDVVVGFGLDGLDVPYVRRYPLLPG